MIKYYCDICENEIQEGKQNVGALDFTNKVVFLCPSCYSKFKEGKEAIFSEYETKFEEFNSDYLDDLKAEILETNETPVDVDPQPVFE